MNKNKNFIHAPFVETFFAFVFFYIKKKLLHTRSPHAQIAEGAQGKTAILLPNTLS
jgi:hypothetical protein